MWSTIEAAAAAMAQGNFVVVVDNEDRENEGTPPNNLPFPHALPSLSVCYECE